MYLLRHRVNLALAAGLLAAGFACFCAVEALFLALLDWEEAEGQDCIGCMAQHLQAEVGYLQDTTGNVEQHRPHLKAAVECWNSCEQVAEVFFPFLLAGGVLFFIASVFAVSSLVPLCLICCARSETPKIAHLVITAGPEGPVALSLSELAGLNIGAQDAQPQ